MASPAEGRLPVLPDGTRLLHIGPPKTGTSTLQTAMFAARPAMLAQGVRQPARSRHPARAVHAVLGRESQFVGGAVPDIEVWRRLVAETSRAREPRVVISSELLADAPPEKIQAIVDDLDPARIHVAVTLRPLARIIPSQWQQYVQDGSRVSFDRWLDSMLNAAEPRYTPSFWRRHRHDQLIARWAAVVGADRVTAIVLDEREPEMLLRVFEQLLGLRERTLHAEAELGNRSMTLPEVEAVRAFNRVFRKADLPRPLLSRTMHFGAGRYMKRTKPDPDWPRVELPDWAIERTSAIAAEIVAGIRASGVRVVGDLEQLATVTDARSIGDEVAGSVRVPPEVAGTMAMGVLVISGAARGSADRQPPDLQRIPTYQLVGVLRQRLVAAGRQRIRRVQRRGKRSARRLTRRLTRRVARYRRRVQRGV